MASSLPSRNTCLSPSTNRRRTEPSRALPDPQSNLARRFAPCGKSPWPCLPRPSAFPRDGMAAGRIQPPPRRLARRTAPLIPSGILPQSSLDFSVLSRIYVLFAYCTRIKRCCDVCENAPKRIHGFLLLALRQARREHPKRRRKSFARVELSLKPQKSAIAPCRLWSSTRFRTTCVRAMRSLLRPPLTSRKRFVRQTTGTTDKSHFWNYRY